MLGLGETDDELRQTLKDLRLHHCRMITLGQYLQPSKVHHPVVRFVPPEAFQRWEAEAREMGFLEVASGPFVRSSYHAKESYRKVRNSPKDESYTRDCKSEYAITFQVVTRSI
jgi:lipoic acid synthetase